jgi:LmbE family N-acetylglucosaminyl deacetylase
MRTPIRTRKALTTCCIGNTFNQMRRNAIAFGLLFIIILVPVLLARYISAHRSPPQSIDLATLPLAGHHRLLVLAPHCDDETLGSGGLIQAAIRAGIEVRVVVATNGDGYLFATMQDFRKIYPRPADFIHMGSVRQQETLSALKVLGVPNNQVTFLSYPDRGLPALWNQDWNHDHPYNSPYIEANHSPYALTFDPKATYSGEDLLMDLRTILQDYHPDLITYPHPDDLHPDHWGLSLFSRLAIAETMHIDTTFHPDAYGYLVHRPDFPSPGGLHPSDSLLPPPRVADQFPAWFQLNLEASDIATKEAAISSYHSQLPLLRGLLESFVRTDEPFNRIDPITLPDWSSGSTVDPLAWHDENGVAVPPIVTDPIEDNVVRNLIPGADLIAVYAAIQPDNTVLVCGQLRGNALPGLHYVLRISAISDSTVIHQTARNFSRSATAHPLTFSGPFMCDQVSFADLGHPWLLAVGADVEESGVGILDQIAWQLANVEPVNDTTPPNLSTNN